MGFGAPSATPCLAGFFALRCFSLITIWVTPESWVVKPITSLPHWFYTRILRVPKCFSPQAFSLTPKSAHNLGENDAWRFHPCAPAIASVRGNPELTTPVKFEHTDPDVVPRVSLTGDSTQRVDSRVLQVIYSFDRGALPVYVGQQMDVFIEVLSPDTGKKP